MGGCASIPRPNAAAAAQPAAAGAADADGSPATSPREVGPSASPDPPRHAPTAASNPTEVLEEVHELQKELSEVSSNALLGLIQAIEVLVTNGGFAADTAAVYGAVPDEPDCLVLLAACGAGAAALERAPVARSADAANAVSAPDLAAPGALELLPLHLRCLAPSARSVAVAPLGPAEWPLGCLVLASHEPCAFDCAGWRIRQHAAAVGLLRLLKQPPVAAMCRLLSEMRAARDPLEAVSALLQAGPHYMASCTHLQMALRLAILPASGPDGAPAEEATLFELPRGRTAAAPPHRASGPRGVSATGLSLHNTLLASAVKHKQARFVVDCGRYLQCCVAPARDVFTRASDLVSSIVVLPLLPPHGRDADAGDGGGGGGGGEDAGDAARGAPLGAVYFSLPDPCDFRAPRDALLGFVHAVTPMLYWKLAGRDEELADALARAAKSNTAHLHGLSGRLPRVSGLGAPGGSSTSGCAPGGGAGGSTDGAVDCDGSGSGRTSSSPPHAHSSRLSCLESRPLNTEAMLQVFQAEVHKGCRRGAQAAAIPGLSVIAECLGDGDAFEGKGCSDGACTVHRAFWNRSAAAVKIIRGRSTEQEALLDATQMAVMSSVTHPNLVKAFVCLTDVVECGEDEASSVSSGPLSCGPLSGPLSCGPLSRPLRFRRALPDEPSGAAADPVCLIVMELADLGTLSGAMARGALHVRLPGGAVGIDLRAALEALLDAACGLSHLHSLHIAHGGVRAANVLLKSDASRPLGWTAKLGGFGSARILNARGEQFLASRPAGSVAHLAPETLEMAKVSTAADVYSFGILMHEVYTGSEPFPGVSDTAIAPAVRRGGVRPRLPCGTPDEYARLASDCWAADPAVRPDMVEVIARLEALHTWVVGTASAQGGALQAGAVSAVEAR